MGVTPELIGKILQNCSAVELIVNGEIQRYSVDEILAKNAIKSPFSKANKNLDTQKLGPGFQCLNSNPQILDAQKLELAI